ncbi:MAG: response regulator [Candidatus Bathyarchaeota archaeon]|nr:response regulator [Candidatus Bathyarchaeota archaeon]
MSSAEPSDTIESLISLLEENEKKVDALAKKIEENSDVFRSLHSLLEENEKRVQTLEKKLLKFDQKNSGASCEKVSSQKSLSVNTLPARTILIVDDDKKLTSSFKLILENAGYIVEVANTGFTAHILVTKNYYDLVLLDWHLHDAFGDQIADTIEKRHIETKIIFITGYAYILDEYKRENEILLKPIDPDFLLEKVAQVFPNEQNLHTRADIQRYRKERGIQQESPSTPEKII